MKQCPLCDTSYPNTHKTCPTDGSVLIELHTWEPGTIIRGKYRILSILGRGGMGTVYKAEHMALEEVRALKVMSAALAEDAGFVKRFRQEAQAARRLRHVNAVHVDDLDQAEDGSLFIAMDFVDGVNLRQLLHTTGGPLPVDRALAIARGVAEGLGAAHVLGMVHRDIKPDNILLARDSAGHEVPKILDFGIVAMKECSTTFSTRGLMLTPNYAAPEQWRGTPASELDGRTDLYALGGVLYEMLTGRRPFRADNHEGWMQQHLFETPLSPSAHRLELAREPGLDGLVLSLLAKDRADRPASAQAFLQQLNVVEAQRYRPATMVNRDSSWTVIAPPTSKDEAAADGTPAETPVGAPAAQSVFARPDATRRIRTVMLAVAACILAALSLVVWRTLHQSEGNAPKPPVQAAQEVQAPRAGQGELSPQGVSSAIPTAAPEARPGATKPEAKSAAAPGNPPVPGGARIAPSPVPAANNPAPVAPRAASPSGRRLALLLGNSAYRASPLRNPVNDVTDLAVALEKLAFEVKVGTNLGLDAMNGSIREFEGRIRLGDTVLFYYSGHGMQIEAQNLLVPTDFAASTPAEALARSVRFEKIKASLEQSPARVSVLIIDACRENPFRATPRARGLAPVDAGLGSYVVLAASPGQTANDNPGGRNGLFTSYLLRALERPTTLSAALREVRRSVYEASGQRQLPYIHDQAISEFQLVLTSEASLQNEGGMDLQQELIQAKELYHLGQCDEAQKILDRLVRLAPDNAVVRNAAGLCYQCLRMLQPALEQYNRAIMLRPDFAAAYLNRGVLYSASARHELAIDDFNWALEQEPQNASLYCRRGREWFSLRQYEQAEADFTRSIRLDPTDPYSYLGLGRVYHQFGKFNQALECFDTALQFKWDFPEAHAARSVTRDRMGDRVGADADRQLAGRS